MSTDCSVTEATRHISSPSEAQAALRCPAAHASSWLPSPLTKHWERFLAIGVTGHSDLDVAFSQEVCGLPSEKGHFRSQMGEHRRCSLLLHGRGNEGVATQAALSMTSDTA